MYHVLNAGAHWGWGVESRAKKWTRKKKASTVRIGNDLLGAARQRNRQSPSCGLPRNSQIVKPQITTHMYTAAHRWCRTRNGQRMLSTRRNECAAPTYFSGNSSRLPTERQYRLRSSRKKKSILTTKIYSIKANNENRI